MTAVGPAPAGRWLLWGPAGHGGRKSTALRCAGPTWLDIDKVDDPFKVLEDVLGIRRGEDALTVGKVPGAIARWSRISADRAKHVLKGYFTASGKFKSGLHDINEARSLNVNGKIKLVEKNTAANEVTQGFIDGKFKTFFPKSWSEQQILDAGRAAADQAQAVGNISGKGEFFGEVNRIKIRGFYFDSAKGDISSFFPHWPQYSIHSMMKTISINVETLPEIDCLNYPRGQSFKQNVLVHITQECDSNIDFVVNGKNVLNGYEGAFVYPTHNFLMSMNNGLVLALTQGRITIPIFLQQYSFSEDSPQHQLGVHIDPGHRERASVTFRWCESIERPQAVPTVEGESVLLHDFVTAVAGSIDSYRYEVARLFLQIGGGLAEEGSTLFSGVADLAAAWSGYQEGVA